ncbi:regulator of microtubule dynamics protein 3 [Takifugu rubripes]|uniref:Regulator of microtubule dynamics protein 3 n=1 Tax=Takifugu rubripes TaxID=31033 RepID=A0A3B5KHL2_TAKRU|nr:regulator of microtubule dynamics protein 3 [Takifugu rubripes]|eukprot:XP_011616768.1 PREDICTED: regulator of microtubule dynamics protein 3 [Takifugu rubripes]
MNTWLGRNGLIGLAVGASAAFGFIAYIIYREKKSRKMQKMILQPPAAPQAFDLTDGATLLRDTHDAQVVEAQRQALAAVEAVLQGLSPNQQLELRNQLDQVLNCVASLRTEVAELRGGLQDIAQQMIPDVNQRVRRRRHVVHRERTDSTSSSSIYFTASQSAFEDTSEGGYTTAYAESDYTDRDSEKEEGDQEPEQESDEDEKSCATVVTLRQEDSQEEEDEDSEIVEEVVVEDGRGLDLTELPPNGELALLLAQSDILHTGDATLKAEGYHLLLANQTEYGDSREFLWRFARAYSDMYICTENKQEKKMYALQGLEEAELALKKTNLNAECHKWFALLAGLTSQNESMHSKLKSSYLLKEHLEHFLTLRDDDPMCFYLLGRWCYEVANLDWLEKKTAAAIYQKPPTATLNDALENFLKAEELSPGFSKMVRLCIAKCHNELGNLSEARNWTDLALKMTTNSSDVRTNFDFQFSNTIFAEEASKLEAQLRVLTDNSVPAVGVL